MTTGFCQCGCGGQTTIAASNNRGLGRVRGQPMRWITGHNVKAQGFTRRAGRWVNRFGYVLVWAPDHPRAASNGYALEHVVIAERVLGKPLPKGAEIHHVNERRAENTNANLVICQDDAYHKLLHTRMRALAACGNPNWRKCLYCKRYDDVDALRRHGRGWLHPDCAQLRQRDYNDVRRQRCAARRTA